MALDQVETKVSQVTGSVWYFEKLDLSGNGIDDRIGHSWGAGEWQVVHNIAEY